MTTNYRKELAIAIVYLNVALYATCYQLQRPVEPFMIDKLNKSDGKSDSEGLVAYAKLQSFFSALQMIGSIIVGICLDKFGARNMFLVTFVASATSYYLLSQAITIDILYYSKIPTIFQAGFLCAQTMMSQITSDGTDRVTALGRLTMAYTVGSVIGPWAGGYLGRSGDYYFGASLACYGSLLSCALTLLLPSSDTAAKSSPTATSAASPTADDKLSSTAQSTDLWAMFFAVGGLLGTKIASGVANSIRETTLPLILKNIFSMNEQSLGTTMSALSGMNAIVNGLGLGPISRQYGGDLVSVIYLCILALAGLCGFQAILALPPLSSAPAKQDQDPQNGLMAYLGTTFGMTIFAYILSTAATSESTSRVPVSYRGSLLGLEHSLFAAARIFAPAAGVAILSQYGVSGVAATASGIFCAILLAWKTVSGSSSSIGVGKERRVVAIEKHEEEKKK